MTYLINKNYVTKKGRKGESFFEIGGGFDTESTTISEKTSKHGKIQTNVLQCFAYAYQFSIGTNVLIFREISEVRNFLKDFLTELINFNIKRKNKVKFIFWVANLSHDFQFIKELLKEFHVTNFFAKGVHNVLMCELENVLQFREIIGLMGHSLNDIAKKYCKTQKLIGDLDYSKIRTSITHLTNEEINYMKNDVLILSEAHTTVLQMFTQKNFNIPYTTTGLVRQYVKKHIYSISYEKKINEKLIPCENDFNLIRNFGYVGGLCGCNFNDVIKSHKGVQCFDFTSDYPHIMLKRKFPSGEIIQAKNIEEIKKAIAEKKHYYAFIECNINSKFNHGSITTNKVVNFEKIKNKLIVVNNKVVQGDNLIIIINEIELKTIRLLYDLKINKILKFYYFTESAHIPKHLKQSIEYFYIHKSEIKKEGTHETTRKVEYKDTKSQLNAVYGMCATRAYKKTYFFNDETKEIDIKEKSWSEIKSEFWLNPYIAFYTTSYARLLIAKFISLSPDTVIQYDTDSIYCKDDKLNKYIDIYNDRVSKENKCFKSEHLKDIGYFVKDGFYDVFYTMGAKRYITEKKGKITATIAGLPKESISNYLTNHRINNSEFYNQIENLINTDIIFNFMDCKKFASVYSDEFEHFEYITDYEGLTHKQYCCGYHAITEIDFNLFLDVSLCLYLSNTLQNYKCSM